MVATTPIKTSTSIAIGLGRLQLDDSATHIAEFSRVLGSSAYVGAHSEISIVASKEILEQEYNKNGFREVVRRLVTKAGISLNCNILELTTKNMSYSFGGDGGAGNILNDLFGVPSILRAELVFLYPNKITQMIVILPSVQVVSGPNLGFKAEEAMGSSITLSSLATDEATWASDPLGRVYFEEAPGTMVELLQRVSNLDIDTGTETVDSFADTEGKGADWSYVVDKGPGTHMRKGKISACWDGIADSTPIFEEVSTTDIGDTSGVVFGVDKSGNTVRLRCTVDSDNWSVEAVRCLVG